MRKRRRNDGGIYKARDIQAVTGVTTGWTVLNNGLAITQFYGGAGNIAAGGGRIVRGTQDNGDLVYPGTGTSWTTFAGGDGGYSAADSGDDRYIYGEYTQLAIHRSTNGGQTFAQSICVGISEGNTDRTGNGCGGTGEANFIAPFILDPNNNNRMLAGAKSLWVSNDVKAPTPTWAVLKPPAGSGSTFYISAITVAEGNPNIIWVGHNNGQVYKTINGNAANPTWMKESGARAYRREAHPACPGGSGRQSVPGTVGCGTSVPSSILLARTRGRFPVRRSPTGAHRRLFARCGGVHRRRRPGRPRTAAAPLRPPAVRPRPSAPARCRASALRQPPATPRRTAHPGADPARTDRQGGRPGAAPARAPPPRSGRKAAV